MVEAGVTFLSRDWLALACQLFGKLPTRPGASARLQHVVGGAPGGDVVLELTFEDGRLVRGDIAPGPVPDPDAALTITTTYPDTQLLVSGDLDLSVAVMQGRAKVAGAMDRLFAILPVMRTPEFRAALATLDERTAPPG